MTIRNTLGQLQDDPENAAAWSDLKQALGFTAPEEKLAYVAHADSELSLGELDRLIDAARNAHEMRREYEAVTELLRIQMSVAHGTPRELELAEELARVLDDELLDDERAAQVYERILALEPGQDRAEEALERSTARRAKWPDLVTRYVEEARSAQDPAIRSSFLVSAAETAFRYGRPDLGSRGKKGQAQRKALLDEVIAGLSEALETDPKNRRAALLLEQVYREEERYEELAAAIERFATESTAKEEKIAGYLRLGRLERKRLGRPGKAAFAYERVLDISPGHPEAMGFLVDYFTQQNMWEHVVALYEEQLSGGGGRQGQEAGILIQIAMIHWRMRERPDQAEPYFEKLRKSDPAQPAMLSFFREWCEARGDSQRLAAVLGDAQRAMPDGPERAKLAVEIARLAEDSANAAKAIEQWRAILRQDPSNADARSSLRRLYRLTSGWNALVDLLRGELERVPANDAASRLPLLREIAAVYRDHLKSDSALVTVLTQIVTLAPHDVEALRELARVYESLQRWRDLLTIQARLAELEAAPLARAQIYRGIARRWLDQFSNVQNAVEAYEKLREASPADPEAMERLKELYGKRRAYPKLFELHEAEVALMPPGEGRRALIMEMAKLAAERLDRGSEAVRLYKRVLDEEPSFSPALDALEKQAERDKDFASLAVVLEKRVDLAADDTARLAALQKLGAVYTDRLGDNEGASRAWTRVLELAPTHPKALRVLRDRYLETNDLDALMAMYERIKDFEGLAEVLSSAADKATDPDVKIDLSFRAAAVYRDRLSAPERAFRAYERVLAVRPDDERAALALVPLYEVDEKWGRLPPLYEVLLRHEKADEVRLALYEKLVVTSGERLHDRPTAFAWARKAYELAPTREGALERLEAIARTSGKWVELCDILRARLEGNVPAEEARSLRLELARIKASELSDVDEAVGIYKELLHADPSDEEVGSRLDGLLRAEGRHDDLRWLLRLRVDRADPESKAELLLEWATLEEDVLLNNERAIALFRELLGLVPTHARALRALSRLLRAAGDAAGAAEILERDRDQREGVERVARELELAELYLGSLDRPTEALAAVERALELVPDDASAISIAERLLPLAATRARAAVLLDASYAKTGNLDRQAEVLGVRIATASASQDRLALYQRLAEVHEKQGGFTAAFEVVARAAGEFPAELTLWDRLAGLAARTQRALALVEAIAHAVPGKGDTGLPLPVELELADRAATLYIDGLGDVDAARPYLERILTKDPRNERAFARLKQILTTREQWSDLEAAYGRVIAAATGPAERSALALEVALLVEEIVGQPERAIVYYERILADEPEHELATSALDKLYARQGEWAKLAGLLTRKLEGAVGEVAAAIRLRLGRIYHEKLADPTTALGYLEEVLAEAPNDREATALVEATLPIPELRGRAAAVLEGVYAQRGESRELVRALEIRLEFVQSVEERRELLRRVAELRDEKLIDDEGALEAYARLVPLTPADVGARKRLLEIAARVGAMRRAGEVLREAASAADAPQPRADILLDVAKIHEGIADAARAEQVYREVLELDRQDAQIALPASRALERIYGATGRSAELADMLRVQVALEDELRGRKQLLARLGSLWEEQLADVPAAIGAWRTRLDDDPTDEEAIVALDRLYERAGDYRALVDILRARERFAQEPSARRPFMVRAAAILDEKLGDVPEAILAYRAVLDDFGADRALLAALAALYAKEGRSDDLAETIEAELLLVGSSEERLVLLTKLGEVRRTALQDTPAAIDAYREALTLDPSHPESRAALEGLLAHDSASRDAAEILRPLYEADGNHEKLLRVLDIQIGFADSVDQKLSLLGLAADVAETRIGDDARAFQYAARGTREAASEFSLPGWLERIERLTEKTGDHAAVVKLLQEVVPDILDEERQVAVLLRIAELARDRIVDRALARTYFEKALELRGEDERALVALEAIHELAGNASELHEILRRRADVARTDGERKEVLYKEARLCDEKLGDKAQAISVYERILDIALEGEAIAALERLYGEESRWDDLVALYERRLAAAGITDEGRATLHHGLGELYESRLGDAERAFDEYASALALEPQHGATVASLEALMAGRTHAARAAEILESVYLARHDWRKVMGALEARLASSQDPDERRQILRRLAKLEEEQADDCRAALEVTARLLAEDIADDTTRMELERLARASNASERLAEIYASELAKVTSDEPATARLAARTGELFEAQGDPEKALELFRRAYAFAPEEQTAAFAAVDRLLTQAGRPAERISLYRDALEYRHGSAERLATFHAIADLQRNQLHDEDAAIETYRAALEVDDTDVQSLDSLTRLYLSRERFPELAEHLRRRAEQSALPEDEALYRYDLASVRRIKLDDLSGAIDEYEIIVGLLSETQTGHYRETVAALESLLGDEAHRARVVEILRPLYERADDWQHLVSVNGFRLALAADAGEKIAILRENAKLLEQRGHDIKRAFDALAAAFVLDPNDGDTRGELDRVAEATGRWDDLAGSYERGVEVIDGFGQRELLEALARLHDKRRDDPRRALAAYDRLFKLDENDVRPLDEMVDLATLLSDWDTLVHVLVRKVELMASDDERASTWRRIGEARRDMLDDLPGAVDAYERALDLEPDSAFTLDNLIPLYEAKNDAARLVDLYRRRIELCGEDDGGLKFQLLLDAAERYEVGLGDRREAISLLGEALAAQPNSVEVLGRLGRLYEAELLWSELHENLRARAARETDVEKQRSLKKRVGALLAGELDDPAQALTAYGEVLASGFDEEASSAIRKIGETRDELRFDAASTLEPILRVEGRFAELVDILELRLRAESDAQQRARTLRSIAELAEQRLEDPTRAQRALLRAIAEDPSNEEPHAEVERLAVLLGRDGWERYAAALGERATSVFDSTITADLYSRLGRIQREELKDAVKAAEAFQHAAEQGGDTPEVLSALESVFAELGDTRALADVIERRIAIESDAVARAGLVHRLACLQIESLDSKPQGLATLRTSLEVVPDHAPSRELMEKLLEDPALFDDAFETLEGVYRSLSMASSLGALYARRVERAVGGRDRVRARLEHARILENEVHEPDAAQRAIEAALGDDSRDPELLGELERLAAITGAWARAADAVASALDASSDGRLQSVPLESFGEPVELWIRLAGWRKDRVGDAAGAEAALRKAWSLDRENLDAVRALEALLRVPDRERDLVLVLRERAKLETDPETKRGLLREAKEIAQNIVGDPALAEAALREQLAENEADDWALAELTMLREHAGDHAEVVALLLRRAESSVDSALVLELRHRAAAVVLEKLSDKPRAIALYQDILQGDPDDAPAAQSLRTLYAETDRQRDLGRLLESLIDNARTAEARLPLRLDLARLQMDKFDAPNDAIDTLNAILEQDPDQRDAALLLSEILQRTGQDDKLADLLDTQIERARARGDTEAEFALQVRLGEVLEARLKDTGRALATYESVLERDPTHRAALEAVARMAEARSDWSRAASSLARLVDIASAEDGKGFALRLADVRTKLDDQDGVEDALKRAIALVPPGRDVRPRLLVLYERRKKWAELAELLVEEAALNRPASFTVSATGVALEVAEPVRLLRRAAEIHVVERKSPADAVPVLEKATEFAPNDRELLLLLCDAYTSSGREREAATVLERIIASFGQKRTKELSVFHHRLGKALAQLGQKDVALSQLDLAFKIDPGSVPVLRDLGVLAIEIDDLERAQKTFRALLLQRLDARSGISKGEVFLYLGDIAQRQGDLPKAKQMLERALENEPGLDRAKSLLASLKS